MDAPVIAELERQSQMRLDTLTQEVENVRRVVDMQGMLLLSPTLVSTIDPTVYKFAINFYYKYIYNLFRDMLIKGDW